MTELPQPKTDRRLVVLRPDGVKQIFGLFSQEFPAGELSFVKLPHLGETIYAPKTTTNRYILFTAMEEPSDGPRE